MRYIDDIYFKIAFSVAKNKFVKANLYEKFVIWTKEFWHKHFGVLRVLFGSVAL